MRRLIRLSLVASVLFGCSGTGGPPDYSSFDPAPFSPPGGDWDGWGEWEEWEAPVCREESHVGAELSPIPIRPLQLIGGGDRLLLVSRDGSPEEPRTRFDVVSVSDGLVGSSALATAFPELVLASASSEDGFEVIVAQDDPDVPAVRAHVGPDGAAAVEPLAGFDGPVHIEDIVLIDGGWIAVTPSFGGEITRYTDCERTRRPLAIPGDGGELHLLTRASDVYVISSPVAVTDWLSDESLPPGGAIRVIKLPRSGDWPEDLRWELLRELDPSEVHAVRLQATEDGFLLSVFHAEPETVGTPALRLEWLDPALEQVAELELEPGGWGTVTAVGSPPEQDLFLVTDLGDASVRHARVTAPGQLSQLRPVARAVTGFGDGDHYAGFAAWSVGDGRRAVASYGAGSIDVGLFECTEE